eukprot:g22974.t1
MWVLLLSGTFLDSPSVALNEVGATSGWLVALFLVFIFLSHMMVLNMLIGILCDVVHQVALNEKEEARLPVQLCWLTKAAQVPHFELQGKILGLIGGSGGIGSQVAALAEAIGMKVVITSRISTAHQPLELKDTLKLMKPTAYLINTGRGSLIKDSLHPAGMHLPLDEEPDLIEALEQKAIAGAGLDVQETEPPPEDSPLYTLENVILTPHIGWKRLETRQRLMDIVAANLTAFLAGKPVNVAAVAYLKNTLLEILECHDKDNDRQIHRDEFELLMRNPEMHFVLTRFGVNVADLLNLKDVLFEDNTEQEEDEEEDEDDTNSHGLNTARRKLRKLSFQEFLEVVLRLRGGNSATVTDIVDLREYARHRVRQRFDRMDLRVQHAASVGGSPSPNGRLRTMKSMPARGTRLELSSVPGP